MSCVPSLLRAACLVVICSGCAVGSSPGTDELGDGGPEPENAGELDCVDAGPDCVPRGDVAAPCESLVEVTCGSTCGESPGCAAALLLREHEPDRCPAALADTQTFPPCELGSCDVLVEKACGADPPLAACVDAPGCGPAVTLQGRARDPEATQESVQTALQDCLQALEDDVVFAACP